MNNVFVLCDGCMRAEGRRFQQEKPNIDCHIMNYEKWTPNQSEMEQRWAQRCLLSTLRGLSAHLLRYVVLCYDGAADWLSLLLERE
jgi:hypothetical protein